MQCCYRISVINRGCYCILYSLPLKTISCFFISVSSFFLLYSASFLISALSGSIFTAVVTMSIPDACLLSHTHISFLLNFFAQRVVSLYLMLNNLHTQRYNLHKEHQEIIFASQSQKYTAEIYAYKMKDSIFITSFVNNIPCNEQ